MIQGIHIKNEISVNERAQTVSFFFSGERERERVEIFKNSQFLIVCGIGGGESDTRYSYKK